MTPQINCLEKMNTVLGVFSTYLRGLWKEIHGKTSIFQSKCRYVTPEIDHLGKRSTVLRVSTHIYGVSKEIDGNTSIFQSKHRHDHPSN